MAGADEGVESGGGDGWAVCAQPTHSAPAATSDEETLHTEVLDLRRLRVRS